MRSHDAETQVGCVIVNEKNRIIGTGYNGYKEGLDDEKLPNTRPEKYEHIIHAEINALMNATQSVVGSTCYVTLSPCTNCYWELMQAGVKKVIYKQKYERDFVEETGMIQL